MDAQVGPMGPEAFLPPALSPARPAVVQESSNMVVAYKTSAS
jgi:hypothetical protein